MSDYLPPTENLPTYDSIVFKQSNEEYLTYDKAKKMFLKYPVAQGKETLQAVDINGATNVYNNFLISPSSSSLNNLNYVPSTNTLTITNGAGTSTTITNVGISQTLTTTSTEYNLVFSLGASSGNAVLRKGASLVANPSTGLLGSVIMRNQVINTIDANNSPQTYTQIKSTSNSYVIDQTNQKNSSISLIPYDINGSARQYKFNYNNFDMGAGNITNAFSITANDAFYGDLVGNASSSSSSAISENNSNTTFYPIFTNNSGTAQTLTIDKTTGPFSYNPFTGTLTCTNFAGTADNALHADNADFANSATSCSQIYVGNNNGNSNYYLTFTDGYNNIKSLSVDAITSPLTYNPFTGTLTAINFNGTALNATNAYMSLDSSNTNCPITFSLTNTAGFKSLYQNNSFYYNPSTQTLTVPNIAGSITTATYANNIYVSSDAQTGTRYLPFGQYSASGYKPMFLDSTLNYDTDNKILNASNLNASSAINAPLYQFSTTGYNVPVQTRNLFDNNCIDKYEERFSRNVLNISATTGNMTFDLYWYIRIPTARTTPVTSVQVIRTYNISSSGVTFTPAVSKFINGNNLLIQSLNQPSLYTTICNNGIQYLHTQSTLTYEVCFYMEHTPSSVSSGVKIGFGQALNTSGNYDINTSTSLFSAYLSNNVNGNYDFFVNGSVVGALNQPSGNVRSRWVVFKITILSSTQIRFDIRGLFSGSGLEYTYTYTYPTVIPSLNLFSAISLCESGIVNNAYILVNKISTTYAQQNINNI